MTDEEIKKKVARVSGEIDKLVYAFVAQGFKYEKAVKQVHRKLERKRLLGPLEDGLPHWKAKYSPSYPWVTQPR